LNLHCNITAIIKPHHMAFEISFQCQHYSELDIPVCEA